MMSVVGARWDRALGRGAIVAAMILVSVAVLAPIAMVVFAALRSDSPGSPDAAWTLGNLASVYGTPAILEPLLNTLLTCVPGTLIAVILGFALAWIVNRTDVPGRRWLESLLLIPVYFSPLSLAVGWVVLASPRVGLLNLIVPGVSFVNVYSWTAIILFIGLYYTPYVYLIAAGGLRSLDAGYEDASAILGGGPLRTLRAITLPMLRPQVLASALLVFILSVSMFAEPDLFGVRFNFSNLPLAVYRSIFNIPADFNMAAAVGTAMLLGALAGLLIYRWALSASERFITTQTRGFVSRRITLGKLKPVAFGLTLAYILALVVLPILALVYVSFIKFLTPRLPLVQFTTDHFTAAFTNPMVSTAIFNTVVLSLGVATVATVFGFLVAYNIVRREVRGAAFIDLVSILPIGVPAIVLSLGFMWSYLWSPIPIYGTTWALLIAMSTAIIPNAIRTLDAAIRQLGGDVEFAARILGAGQSRRMIGIVVPMIKGQLVSAWLFAFILTTIQVSVPIVLRTTGQETLSVAVWSLLNDSGDIGQASVVALIQAVIVAVVVLAARLVSRQKY